MNTPLKVVMLEDRATDAELNTLELRRAGFDPQWSRAATEAEFVALLASPPDIILADFQLPHFDGLSATRLAQARLPEVPVIIISGELGDETATECIKAGATDYVLKDRLARLGVAVRQALETARLRSEQRKATEALRESNERLQLALQASQMGVWTWDVRTDAVFWSPECHSIMGTQEFDGTMRSFSRWLHPDDHGHVMRQVEVAMSTRTDYAAEFRIVRASGEVRWLVNRGRTTFDAAGKPRQMFGTVQDITDRKAAEEARERLAEVMRGMNEACFALDAHWRFTFVNDRGEALLRHRRTEMIGHSIWEVFQKLVGTPMEGHYRRAMRERVALSFEAWSPIAERWLDVRLFPSGDGLAAFLTDIDDRKKAEEGLRKSEELYRSLVTASPDAIVLMDLTGIIAYASDQARRLFGFPPEMETAGLNVLDRLVPADRARALENIRRLTIERTIGVNQYTLMRRDGETFEAEITAALMTAPDGTPQGVILVARDISLQLAAAAALRDSEARFRQVVESIHEVFWVTDPNKNQILYVSPAYEKVWGRSCQSLYDSPRNWLEAICPEDRERVFQAMLKQATGTYDEEYRIARPDGAISWIHDRAFPVRDEAGQILRIVGVAEDITRRKTLEEQFLRAQRLEAIGTLAGGIAHDLNNILSPVLMGAGLLTDRVSDARDRDLLKMIQVSAERGTSVVRQLLTFSRGIAGERVAVQLRHLIKDMVDLMRETFPRDISIEESAARDLRTVIGDPTQLHQVILNLCVNARDAMPQGGKLTITANHVELSVDEVRPYAGVKAGEFVALHVADTGHGIPPAIVDRIFDPFFTTKEVGKGTGLGLSTVLGIARSHGGFVNVDSAPEKGAAFTVYLPIAADECARAKRNPSGDSPQGNGELILVVDDEAPIRKATQLLLEKHGYRVVSAVNGEAALAVALANGDAVKLVLTDLMMPVMNGVTFIRALRSVSPRVAIIATSGLTDQANHAGLNAIGVNYILAKPCTMQELLAAVRKQLASSVQR